MKWESTVYWSTWFQSHQSENKQQSDLEDYRREKREWDQSPTDQWLMSSILVWSHTCRCCAGILERRFIKVSWSIFTLKLRSCRLAEFTAEPLGDKDAFAHSTQFSSKSIHHLSRTCTSWPALNVCRYATASKRNPNISDSERREVEFKFTIVHS